MIALVFKVPSMVLAEANPHSDTLQACPLRFTVRFATMLVSGVSGHQSADQIAAETVAVDADHSCQFGQSTTTIRSLSAFAPRVQFSLRGSARRFYYER